MTSKGADERLFTRDFILLWTTSFITFSSFQIFLPILPLYVASIGGTESQVGLVVGIVALSAVTMRTWVGREADRRGKKVMLVWGALAFLVSTSFYPLASSVALLLLLRLFHGAAFAGAHTPAVALVADTAPARRRGEAMGWYGTAPNLGMAVAPLLAVALVGAYGFNAAFMAAGALALVALATASLLREPGPQAGAGPEPAPASASPRHTGLVYGPALFPALTAFNVTLTFGSVITFLPILALRSNVNPGLFFTVYAVCLIASRPLGGKLADSAGRGAAIMPGMAALALGLGLLAFASDLPGFLAAAALYGIGFSFVNPSLMALTVDRAAPDARGIALGTFSAAFDLGIGLGSILFGLLLERTSFQVLYLAAAGVGIASLVIYALGDRRG